jgi:intracellular multiplication protein IcmE
MSDELKQQSAGFIQNKTRWVIIAVAVVLVLIVSFFWYRHNIARQGIIGSASLSGAPAISSIPGAGVPSAHYVKTQNLENQAKAQAARETGGSAVPTLVRPDFSANLNDFEPAMSNRSAPAEKAQCASAHTLVKFKPNPLNCTVDNLKAARAAGVTADELACQGCSLTALKDAGYTSGDLKGAGALSDQLRSAGYSAADLLAAGYDAAALKKAGVPITQLCQKGFTPAQLAQAGYSAAALKQCGFSQAEIAQVVAHLAHCSISELKQQKAAGIDPAALKSAGCSAAALMAAGYSPSQLAAAGFSSSALKAAGADPKALLAAGASIEDLKKAGFTAAALIKAGVSPAQSVAAGYSPAALKAQGVSASTLRQAGMSAVALKAAGYTKKALKAGGYTQGSLTRAGFVAPSDQQSGRQSTQAVNPRSAALTESHLASSDHASARQVSTQDSADQSARYAKALRAAQDKVATDRRQGAVQELQGSMMMQANSMVSQWAKVNAQSLVSAPVKSEELAGQAGTAAALPNGAGAAGQEAPADYIKAGSVMYAALETSINSDEKSPILATIVDGPLKGSRLIGQFSRVNKRLLLSFTLLNTPKYPQSIALNAVAIDPDTARTAMSGQVNNHYLLRYGSVIASGFLSGLSDALLQPQNQCFFCAPPQQELKTSEYVMAGLGGAGRQYATSMSGNFNREPTVKIAGGIGMGILLMSDLKLPLGILSKKGSR